MLSIQVLNTKGAARRLGCSETWIINWRRPASSEHRSTEKKGNSLSTKRRPGSKSVRSPSWLRMWNRTVQLSSAAREAAKTGAPQLLTHLFVCTKNQRGGGAWNRRDTGLTQWAVVACKLLDSLVVVTKKQPPGASHIQSEHGRKGW